MNQATPTPGRAFRDALAGERPLQIVGVIHAYAARQAREAGFRALYISGAGVANASYGLPDLGFTTRDNVLTDVRRICGAVDLPVLVDIDTGWDDPGETVRAMIETGAAAVHLEDQVDMKRCGHRPGKRVVPKDEMCRRVEAAAGGKTDADFVLMARTDAAAVEGLESAIDRAKAYVDAGADMIFAEAMESEADYRAMTGALNVPVLANMTEFGKSPLMTTVELGEAGVAMVLYPLSAFRAMSAAAEDVYTAIRREGTQRAVVDRMQTRQRLYKVLDYYRFEQEADRAMSGGEPG